MVDKNTTCLRLRKLGCPFCSITHFCVEPIAIQIEWNIRFSIVEKINYQTSFVEPQMETIFVFLVMQVTHAHFKMI